MKRLASLALVMCLLLSLSAQALEREAVPDMLMQMAEDYMTEKGYTYTTSPEQKRILASFRLNNTLESCEVYIRCFDDMLRVTVYPSVEAPQKQRDEMAKLLVLINYEISYAAFHMDYEDGEISCIAFQYVEGVLPTVDELDVMVQQPLFYLEDYGDAIVQVANGKLDARHAFDQAQEGLSQ